MDLSIGSWNCRQGHLRDHTFVAHKGKGGDLTDSLCFFFLKLDHSPTTSSQYEALLQQSRDVIPQSLVMVVVGRGCLHGWSMWSIKPAQVTIVKPYFTLVPCKEEIVSRTRFDVKLWPTLKRWNLWGSWDMFQCFCHVFSVISQENVCIQTSKLHGVLKCLLMRVTQDTQRFFFKVSWCPTASLQWNSLIRSPSVFVGGYFHKANSKVCVTTWILYDFVGAIDCTIPSFLGIFAHTRSTVQTVALRFGQPDSRLAVKCWTRSRICSQPNTMEFRLFT